jgi:hypothetical protein
MKTALHLCLVASLVSLLVACGGGSSDANVNNNPAPPPKNDNPPPPPIGPTGNNPSTLDPATNLVDTTPKNTVMPAVEFNTYAGSDNQSDTTGNFPGAVLFAQSQIFPATVRIADDVQPYMTSLRDALVLFKPLANVNLIAGKGIVLKAYKADGSLLDTRPMEHPNDIPKTPRFLANIDLAVVQANADLVNPTVVSLQADLTKLNDANAEYLKSLLAANSSIKIDMADGRYVSDIYIPSGSYVGKRIQVVSAAGYSAKVNYLAEVGTLVSKTIDRGTNEVFFAAEGDRWVNRGDSLDHSRYVYGKSFWTAKLPKEWIVPGLKLEFIQGDKKGSLNFAAQGRDGLKIGAPNELLMHTIDVGMLTDPRDKFDFAKDLSLQAEYFQTIPVSRQIVGKYESLKLEQVVLPDGRTYTPSNLDNSLGVGLYSGAMHDAIAKLLILHGINNANYGYSSSSSTSERWDEGGHPYWAAQIAAINAIGKYAVTTDKVYLGLGGLWVHGLSGGAGMLSIKESAGNEFSQEAGHNYGLLNGSGERGVKGAIHRPSDQVNSTWGWDSVRNVFIPNFVQKLTYQTTSPARTFEKTCNYIFSLDQLNSIDPSECVAPFKINETTAFSFGRDAMSNSAIPNNTPYWSQVNRYTALTPHSAALTQAFFESKAVFDKTSSTGFRKWNPSTYKMDEVELRVPVSTLEQTVARKPTLFGVPVTTIVGYYDPQNAQPAQSGWPGYIYPALHGAYGFVYPSESNTRRSDGCWLEVTTSQPQQSVRRYQLLSSRLTEDKMNKFHVNVPQSEGASYAAVFCGGAKLVDGNLSVPKNPAALTYSVNGMPLSTK